VFVAQTGAKRERVAQLMLEMKDNSFNPVNA
jgi:hypothetical protein